MYMQPMQCRAADGNVRRPYPLKVCPHCQVVSPSDLTSWLAQIVMAENHSGLNYSVFEVRQGIAVIRDWLFCHARFNRDSVPPAHRLLLTKTQVWNRDVSAAKNMLRCVLATAENHSRPVALRRAHALPNDAQLAAVEDDLAQAQDAV